MHAAGFQQKKLELCLLTKTVGLGGVQLYNIQEKRQLEEERGQPSLGRPGALSRHHCRYCTKKPMISESARSASEDEARANASRVHQTPA